MVYDTIEYYAFYDRPELLLVLDFSKAFDTIEWQFISEVLKLFEFGDFLIKMIKLCQFNSTSRVEQNGYLSAPIVLERGCRQGDPLSPYVFVMCAEILSHVIREKGDIQGIVVHGEECGIFTLSLRHRRGGAGLVDLTPCEILRDRGDINRILPPLSKNTSS